MVAGVEPGLGMWPFGRHCARHALVARNAHLEAELGRCLDKIRYLEAMRGCEAEERARDRNTIARMRSDLEEAREEIAWQKRRLVLRALQQPVFDHVVVQQTAQEVQGRPEGQKERRAAGDGADEPKKIQTDGSAQGAPGMSYSNKPERIVRIPFEQCAKCSGTRVEQRRTFTKLVSDFGHDNKVHP